MHLAKLLIHVPNVQDQVDVIHIDSGYGPTFTERSNIAPSVEAKIINGVYEIEPLARLEAFPKRDLVTPLDIDARSLDEIEIVLIDEAAFLTSGQREALYGYDITIQLVYEEDYKLTYEEKAAEFELQKTAIETLILQ